MSLRYSIEKNQIWATPRHAKTRTPSRRVLLVHSSRVCYSTGRPKPRWCGLRAFCVWVRKHRAAQATKGRMKALRLRNPGER